MKKNSNRVLTNIFACCNICSVDDKTIRKTRALRRESDKISTK